LTHCRWEICNRAANAGYLPPAVSAFNSAMRNVAGMCIASTVTLLLAGLTSVTAMAGQSAATVYALNCLGCHFPPDEMTREAPPLVGQFAQTESGRVFFIRIPATGGTPLDKEQEARLLREILNWKKSCSVILQDAPLLKYSGPR
jgi:hypothetical protein